MSSYIAPYSTPSLPSQYLRRLDPKRGGDIPLLTTEAYRFGRPTDPPPTSYYDEHPRPDASIRSLNKQCWEMVITYNPGDKDSCIDCVLVSDWAKDEKFAYVQPKKDRYGFVTEKPPREFLKVDLEALVNDFDPALVDPNQLNGFYDTYRKYQWGSSWGDIFCMQSSLKEDARELRLLFEGARRAGDLRWLIATADVFYQTRPKPRTMFPAWEEILPRLWSPAQDYTLTRRWLPLALFLVHTHLTTISNHQYRFHCDV